MEIKDPGELISIIQKAEVCRLGLCDKGVPYIVPVNFGYQEGCLYFHSSRKGKKIKLLKKSPEVCFQVDSDIEVCPAEKACKWNVKYRSVIGYGRAEFVNDFIEKKKALSIIMDHYIESNKSWIFNKEKVQAAAVIRIKITQMTGKKSE